MGYKKKKIEKKIKGKKSTLEKLITIPEIESYSLSPDGSKIVFSSNREGIWALYVMDIKRKKLKKLTTGQQPCLNPKWSPDGFKIAYVSDTDGDDNFDIFVIPGEGGNPINLTHNSSNNNSPQWSPDGKYIAFISNKDQNAFNIFIIPSSRGKPEQITEGGSGDFNPCWSPDGEMIAFDRNNAVWIVSISDKCCRKIVDHKDADDRLSISSSHTSFNWSPEGSELAFVSDANGVDNIGIVSIRGGSVKWFAKSKWEKFNPCWSPDGSAIVYIENVDGNFILKVKCLNTEEVKTISFKKGINDYPVWLPDGRNLVFSHSDARRPKDIWITAEKGLRQLTFSTTEKIDDLVEPELIYYTSFDYLKIPAWLYTPNNFRKERSPAVVWVHGGPESQTVNAWNPWIQFLVNNGYVVLAPNVRGSSGYGRKYRKMSDNDLGGGDLKDVIKAADFLKSTGIANSRKIGIYGKSYGGDLTLLALTKFPERWAAGVSICGAINWKTAFENSCECVRRYMEKKIGTPEGNKQLYYERSPINFIKNLKAAVLIMQGENDPKTPMEEAEQAKEALERHGKRYEYKLYEDEGHDFGKLENKKDALKSILDFFNRYLK